MISFRIAKITRCGFKLRDTFGRTRPGWIEHFHDAALVRNHENISDGQFAVHKRGRCSDLRSRSADVRDKSRSTRRIGTRGKGATYKPCTQWTLPAPQTQLQANVGAENSPSRAPV